MKIPGIDELLEDLKTRGDAMQTSLDSIEALLRQIERNTRQSAEFDPLKPLADPPVTL